MKKIKSILVSGIAPMNDHAANRGEKILGNASSVKRRPDGKVYISGQMQRHVIFSAIDRLNEDFKGTYVSNGDGPSTLIDKDIRSDLGGFLDTKKGGYSGRRTAPLTATPAVALEESSVGTDLLVRLKMDVKEGTKEGKKQALAANEYSSNDKILMNFHLDVGAVGVVKTFDYKDEYHVKSNYESKIDDVEHARRINLFLEAAGSMTDYANQARNAVSGEMNKVLIVLDNKLSRKAIRYFHSDTSDIERKNILSELKDREAKYYLGDDTTTDGLTVAAAFKQAKEALTKDNLYRPNYE